MVRCAHAETTSSGRLSRCPSRAAHTCGYCESHCPCPKCSVHGCFAPCECRRCSICPDHCRCDMAGTGDGPERTVISEDWPSGNPDPPNRLFRPSELGSDSSLDSVRSIGYRDPRPVYPMRDTITAITASRREIAAAWGRRDNTTMAAEPCPMPWETCDMGFTEPVINDRLPDKFWSLETKLGTLIATYRGLTQNVRRTSDLHLVAWPTVHILGRPEGCRSSRELYIRFIGMVSSGAVSLVDAEQDSTSADGIHVIFDAPIPAAGTKRMASYVPASRCLSGAWKFLDKARRGDCAPPWLDQTAYYPTWWPKECYYGSRQTVGTFYEGGAGEVVDGLSAGNERVMHTGGNAGSVAIYAYATDLLDANNAAIWIDAESIGQCSRCVRRGAYVAGTDGRSMFIDARMATALEAVVDSSTWETRLDAQALYPNMAASCAVSKSMSIDKPWTYEWMAQACRMSAGRLLRTIALSDYVFRLCYHGNCVFSMFRSCNDPSGRCMGPVAVELLGASGLISRRVDEMWTSLGHRAVAADGGHIRIAWPGEKPSRWDDIQTALSANLECETHSMFRTQHGCNFRPSTHSDASTATTLRL